MIDIISLEIMRSNKLYAKLRNSMDELEKALSDLDIERSKLERAKLDVSIELRHLEMAAINKTIEYKGGRPAPKKVQGV